MSTIHWTHRITNLTIWSGRYTFAAIIKFTGQTIVGGQTISINWFSRLSAIQLWNDAFTIFIDQLQLLRSLAQLFLAPLFDKLLIFIFGHNIIEIVLFRQFFYLFKNDGNRGHWNSAHSAWTLEYNSMLTDSSNWPFIHCARCRALPCDVPFLLSCRHFSSTISSNGFALRSVVCDCEIQLNDQKKKKNRKKEREHTFKKERNKHCSFSLRANFWQLFLSFQSVIMVRKKKTYFLSGSFHVNSVSISFLFLFLFFFVLQQNGDLLRFNFEGI